MDVMKRVEDLMNKALMDGSTDNERLSSALGALRLIRQYELLGKKKINVAAEILDKVTSQDFIEGVTSRLEKMGDGFERVMGVAKKVGGLAREASGERSGRRRRRRY